MIVHTLQRPLLMLLLWTIFGCAWQVGQIGILKTVELSHSKQSILDTSKPILILKRFSHLINLRSFWSKLDYILHFLLMWSSKFYFQSSQSQIANKTSLIEESIYIFWLLVTRGIQCKQFWPSGNWQTTWFQHVNA